ncbi:MAG: hypothetical protein WD079_02785, partial [Phycisphaeraceae bacterium]
MRGVPAIYFQAIVAAPNDHEGVKRLRHARAINRHKWNETQLSKLLADDTTLNARAFNAMRHMLHLRSRQAAFHPDGHQRVLDLGDAVFAVERESVDGKHILVAVNNMTDQPQRI